MSDSSAADNIPTNLSENPILARWISIADDGIIHIRVGKVELGQGILTALAQMAADELDVSVEQINMLSANTALGPDEGVTSGSMSVAECGSALRLVAANVRMLCVLSAARIWNIDPARVVVRKGILSTLDSTKVLSYSSAAAHIDLDIPADLSITGKTSRQRRLDGQSVPRIDLPDKVAGRPRFIHDFRPPGLHFGRVIRPPSVGATLVDAGLLGNSEMGVTVVRDGSFLGVVGDDEAQVVRAAETLRGQSTWNEHDELPDEHDLESYLRQGPHETTVVVAEEQPQPSNHLTVKATYGRPFIAHASIAPSCGIACWSPDGRLLVWSHSQGIMALRDAIAATLGLNPERVVVEHVEGAGCYGHNGADDAAFDAVLLAQRVPGVPVLVQWTRNDELTWSPFGSAMTADVTATVSSEGDITSWIYEVWSQGHTARPGYAGVSGLLAATTLDPPTHYPAAVDPPPSRGGGTTRNALPLYDLPHRNIVAHRRLTSSLRTSALRSLGAHLNVFAIESLMDELAEAASQDPVQFRLRHLTDDRGRRVLLAAAAAAGWGRTTAPEVGLGIGVARYKGSGAYCAVVAEVEAKQDIKLRRLFIAVDVGQIVNPDGVRNQIEGGATQSASWTLKERVRFDRRRILSNDWQTYPILKFSEAPKITVELLDGRGEPSVGAGEAAQGPTAGAIGNAVTAALGLRVRQLPIDRETVLAAIESNN